MTIPPFRKFPQPPRRTPMTFWEHKAKADWLHNDPESADELIHDLLVGMYPTRECQNS